MSKWNEQAVRHVRTSNNARGIERAGKTAASSLWDGDAFEPGFWDYSGVDAGWQVTAVDLGDPALSMGMVDEDGRFAWQVKDHLGTEIASGASGDFDAALNDAEMAYRIASDEDMDFMSKRVALREIRSMDEEVLSRLVAAGFQDSNWRQYPSGGDWTEIDGSELEVFADYEDALYPDENPRALWCGPAGDDEPDAVYVFNGQGELVETKPAYDYGTATSEANKVLQKLYKGESMVPKGQGKFFTKPGQGKLFGHRSAVAIAPDSQMPMDTGVGNVGTVPVPEASEDNDPDFERNEFTAANITPQDFKHEGEGWYQYEAPDGSSQVSVMEMDSDEWEVDVSFSDGTYQDTVLNSWNDVDAVAAAVEFYNRVASTCRTAGRRTASMWDSIGPAHHVVAGWNYDNLLEGYVAEGSSSHFACICGSNVETPGYGKCTCGKIWNSYTISSQGSTRVVCREIPDRGAEVLLATRKKTAVSWTAQEALDQRGETADHYRIPDKVLDCKECWNSAEANAHDESADPNGYDYGMPVIPMALDYLSNGDLYCEEHYL